MSGRILMSDDFVEYVKSGNVEGVLQILHSNPESVYESLDEDGNSALHLAVSARRDDILGAIINNKERYYLFEI